MKKTALTLILALSFSAVAGVMFADLATANPVVYIYPNDPHTEIQVLSPTNNQTFAVNNVMLSFTLSLSSWYDYDKSLNPTYSLSISPVYYYLDGNIAGQTNAKLINSTQTFSVNLNGVSDGTHTLQVNVTTKGVHWEVIGEWQGEGVMTYLDTPVNDSSDIVYFTVATAQTISPTMLVLTASGASLAVVGIGLLVYFKKRRR